MINALVVGAMCLFLGWWAYDACRWLDADRRKPAGWGFRAYRAVSDGYVNAIARAAARTRDRRALACSDSSGE